MDGTLLIQKRVVVVFLEVLLSRERPVVVVATVYKTQPLTLAQRLYYPGVSKQNTADTKPLLIAVESTPHQKHTFTDVSVTSAGCTRGWLVKYIKNKHPCVSFIPNWR
jgi:hypothetical protein